MSQIENVITTTFRARGNQAIASMGTIAQGFGNIGRVINDNTRLSERLNNQWRAIGTTMRYAIAGTAIFGLTRMVGQLKDVQQQLGLIAAIGQQPGGLFGAALNTRQVTAMGNALRDAAVTAITPVSEMNDAATNFLSTVQNVKPSEVPGIITSLGQAAKLSQTPVDQLTKSVTSMNVAFGRKNDLGNIQAFSRMWFALISTAPGGPAAGQEISNQLPQLASMFMLGRGRNVSAPQGQAQMLSLVLGALRTGSTPSTALRGTTYLLQSLAQPTGKARGALAGIGVTPQFIEQNGIYAALMKLLTTVAPVRGQRLRSLNAMDDTTLDTLDTSGGNLPGIPAREMTRLRTMIPRIHGIRAAIILASQLQQHGDVSSLAQDLKLMDDAQSDQLQGALQLTDAWKRFRGRAKLQQASVAINSMALQVAQTFEPILNFAANRVSGLQGAMARHPTATRNVVLGGAAFMAAMGIGRFAGVGRMFPKGSMLSKVLGGSSLGNKFVMANAAQAAFSGNSTLGGSPQNPLYVVVVGQIFGGATSGPTSVIPPGGGGGGGSRWGRLASIAKKAAGLGAAGAFLYRKAGGLIGKGGAAASAFAAETPMLPDVWNLLAHGVDPTTGQRVHQNPLRNFLGMGFDFNSAPEYQNALRRAQRLYPGTTNIADFHRQRIHGQAEIYMTLDINQNGKITRRRVHVPVDMWSGGRSPSNKATAGNKRGG